MVGLLRDVASADLCRNLSGCLLNGQEWLMDEVLGYAVTHGYAQYTSTLREAWRISLSGLTNSFLGALKDSDYLLELGPDQDFQSDSIAAFAIIEARRHRERGVRLEMFLGLLKYYRQAFLDLVQADDGIDPGDKELCNHVLKRLFDRIEIGFCAEWSASSATHLEELQSSNRNLTNEKNKYLTIFESLPLSVVLLNGQREIDNLNHAATLLLSGGDVPGAHYYSAKCDPSFNSVDGKPGDQAAISLPAWLLQEVETFAARAGLQYHYVEKEVGNRGDERVFGIQLSKMMDVSEKFEGFVVMIQDLSDARKAEKEKARMKAQLLQSDKMASIGQLAAGVAHEINNPIGFVSSNLNRIREYADDMIHLIETYHGMAAAVKSISPLPDDLKTTMSHVAGEESDTDMVFLCEDILAVINESKDGVERVRRIVSDLKDFAHPGLSEPQYTDINHCLESTVNVLQNEIKNKASLTKDFGEIPLILCQPQQLNQVFMNIIINAAQAIEQNGQIGIRTCLENNTIRITITDTGCGMTEEHSARIFEPFFTTKPVGKGTGLGLHIAYQIIRQHKGCIQVESQLDCGTTFTIDLPIGIDDGGNPINDVEATADSVEAS